jgi:hypothetical protein
MALNFNTEPYYDDFNESKKFYRILYRPGFAVQARELTQMQTILQNQVSRFGDHVFKEGAMVIPGQVSVDTKIQYVKLEASYGGVLTDTIIENFLGMTIQNASGLQADVVFFVKSSGSDPAALFVRYKNSADDTTTKVFADGDVIEDVDSTYSVQAIASSATGFGSIATVQQGVYYIKGHFVLVEPQTIVLDKFTNTPSYRIGLVSEEEIITAEDDASLFDNAQNSFNFAAPGAHRYFIGAVLTKLAPDSTADTDFIELVRTGDGQIKKEVRRTEYSVLEETFARRTYDESGNYTVRQFEIDVREYRNNNRGAWTSGRVYLIGDVVTNDGKIYVARNSGTASSSTPPTHTSGSVFDGPSNTGIQWEYNESPFYNRGIYSPGNSDNLATQQTAEARLAVGLEPGKAYVQGYEIEKVSTEYVPVNKSRDFVQVENAVIPATVGNYVLVTNVNNLPPVDTFGTVTLYDRLTSSVGTATGTAIGTARARLIEWHNGTIGTQAAIYKLGLFDIKMNAGVDFNRKVKSFFFDRSDVNLNFSADVSPITTRLVGSATASSSTTITGNGTSFQTDLVVGDFISLGGTVRRVTAIASQVSLTVDASTTVTGVTIDRLSTTVLEPENTSLIFPLPYYAIKDVRSALLANDTVYTVYEYLTGTATSSGSPTLTVSTASGTMASAAETDNYIVVDNNSTDGGEIVLPSSITPSGSGVTFALDAAYSGKSMAVIAAVNKSGAVLTEKTKTLVSGASVTFTTAAAAQKTELLLEKADGYRIVSIKMKSGTFASPGASYSIDISDRYEFDSGQRSTHYDVARLVLKNSYAPPEAPIEVIFDYFTHSTGDYFTVNSYPANVDYKAIPYFEGIALRDVIDFRPRINDAGTGFSSTGASVSLVPKRGIDITTDFTYYLARKVKIAVDFGGNFFSIDGVPSLNPGDPLDPALGLVLYNLILEPYTFGTSSNNVQISKLDNKRYTMRDIGRLEKRIDNLEYYTSLSLLEQQTESLDVIDSNGDTRFKNGFIVDNFAGHNTGDTNSLDYICSIDMEQAELRPFYSMQNINLLEKNSNDTQRGSGNYKLYGDVITLPVLEDIPLITQAYASRLENINPFAVFTFLGDVKINPSSDDWFEIDRRPDLVIDVEGNFNTIKNAAERAGVLGTVWNAWQTQWSGTPVSSTQILLADRGGVGLARGGLMGNMASNISAEELEARFGRGVDRGGNQRRAITVETTATQVGQFRTGVKTTLVTKVDRQVVGDRVLSTAAIPYIRSRNVLIQVKGLKPGTRFYPFFDDISVASYCTPASKIVYTPSGANAAARLATHNTFNDETNVGGLASATARRINGDSQVCLNRGDIITGGSSGATAVIVGKEYNPDAGTFALYVVNIIGTFTGTETITGSISGATGTVGTVTAGTAGGNLVTNFNGQINLLFNIPNTDALRFRCGTREFKLLDVATANGDFTSRGRANYRAEGVLETRQQTVHAVRNAELVEERLADNRVITQTSERVASDTGWWDPLAQTFLIEQRGGCFLSKVDIFFATKDSAVPVTLEIREVVNGYPGKRVLPFSRIKLNPEQVNLSTNTVTLDGVAVNSYDTPTSFIFPSPVYVQENTEYAIVLASDSNNYKVWISQVGDQMPGTARTISEQPYLGSLFKSQNASTWTADQTQDLKFTIYRAKFDTSVVGNIEYVNNVVPQQRLDIDPFETRNGQTKVRVWHRDHGMPSGSLVAISGVASTVNNVPAAELNTTHTISDVDLDSYVITVSTSANASGYGGGSAVRATRNMQFDGIQPTIQVQTFSETPITFGIKTTTGKSVDSATQTAYVQDSSFSGILANENNFFEQPRMIASEINENASTSGNKSLTLNVTMSTTNDALSPILDTHRTSAIIYNNKVNNPSETNMNVAGLDDNVILSNATGVTISGSTITTSTQNAAFLTATVGKYLTIAGASSGSSTRLITAIAADGSSITFSEAPSAISGNATLTQRERFVDEIAPLESSTYSKYVTKRVSLANASNFLRIKFAANIPPEADVEVWYKTAVVGSTSDFESVPYTQISPDAAIIKASNGTNRFVDISYSENDMQAFDAVQVKLVLKSQNTSEVPRIKDLRIIACA